MNDRRVIDRRGPLCDARAATREALPRFLIRVELGGWRIWDTLLGAYLSGHWATLDEAELALVRLFGWAQELVVGVVV